MVPSGQAKTFGDSFETSKVDLTDIEAFAKTPGSGSEEITQPEIVAQLLSNPSISAEGVVREISPVADAATRTFQVRVTLKDPPEQMRFGGSVVGRVKASTQPVIILPGSALFDKGGRPAVWVVDPTNSSLLLKPVKVGRYETDRVVIEDGLAKGDIVVTAGVNRLRENQRVRLTEGASQLTEGASQ